MAQKTSNSKWILHAHHTKAGIYYSSGKNCALQKKFKEAQSQFKEALKENGCCLAANVCLRDKNDASLNTIATFIRRGQCYEELKDWSHAMDNFSAALFYNPTGYYLNLIHLGLGECHIEKGDLIKAKEYLDKAEKFIGQLPESRMAKQYAVAVHQAKIHYDSRKGFTKNG